VVLTGQVGQLTLTAEVVVVVVVVVVAMNIIKMALLQYMLQDNRTNITIKTV